MTFAKLWAPSNPLFIFLCSIFHEQIFYTDRPWESVRSFIHYGKCAWQEFLVPEIIHFFCHSSCAWGGQPMTRVSTILDLNYSLFKTSYIEPSNMPKVTKLRHHQKVLTIREVFQDSLTWILISHIPRNFVNKLLV